MRIHRNTVAVGTVEAAIEYANSSALDDANVARLGDMTKTTSVLGAFNAVIRFCRSPHRFRQRRRGRGGDRRDAVERPPSHRSKMRQHPRGNALLEQRARYRLDV